MDQKYGEFVGVDSLFTADVTADTDSSYTTGTPEFLAPVASIAQAPKVSRKNTYYDNGAAGNSFVTEAETEIKVVVSGIPASKAAKFTGKYYDTATGRFLDTGITNPPDMAIGFRYNVGKNNYRYYWYLKGTFSVGNEESETKDTDVKEKTFELTFIAVVTTKQWTINGEIKPMKRMVGDTTDPAFSPSGWFSQVQTPDTGAAPSAVALSSSVPADDATAVEVTSKPTLTFNNAISIEAIGLAKADGTIVTCTKAWDAAKKVLTITPSTSLAAASVYLLFVSGVKDVYGQSLGASVIKFTTA